MSPLPMRILKVLLPIVVIGGAGAIAYVMYVNRPPVETRVPVVEPPSVRIQRVTFDSLDLTVNSQGTVQPRTTSQLVPEISGTIIEVAAAFAVGGFFEEGDVLVKIDPYDYQQALITGQSQLAQSKLRLAQEEAEAEVARREWQELGRGDASALTLRQPQVEDARAAVAAAEAALERAERDLERAEIRAPYAGRVQSKEVDIGQFVNKGNPIARVYAVDSAEIRLPLPDEELAYVNVPMSYRDGGGQSGPRVTISSSFAGREHTWQGRIVRTESEIDPISRMVHVVAEVRDPYAQSNDPARPPLAAGMFVEAEIRGRTVNDVVVLPWSALRGNDQVLVVDDGNQLHFRQVEVLRTTSEAVLVRGGLAEGELVCISALDTVTDGMAVRVIDDGVQMAANQAGTTTPATPDTPATPATTAARDAAPTAPRAPATPGTAATPRPAAAPGTPATPGPRATPRPPAGADTADAGDAAPATPRAPAAPSTPTPPSAPTPPSPADARDAAPAPGARTQSAGGGDEAFSVDPTLSRAEQFAAIRRELARLVGESSAPREAAAAAAAGRTGQPTAAPPARAADAAIAGRGDPAGRGGRGARGGRGGGRGAGGPGARGGRGGRAPAPSPADAPAPNRPPDPPPASAPEPASTIAPDVPRVAVLPFSNVSRDPADDLIGRALTTALRAALMDQGAVGVIPLAATRGAEALDAAAAREARWLVEGGYQRMGDQLRITAQVLDVEGGEIAGSIKVDGTIAALSGVTDEMVTAVRTELGIGAPAAQGIDAQAARDIDAQAPRDIGAPAPEGIGTPAPEVVQNQAAAMQPSSGVALAPFVNISGNPADDRLAQALRAALTLRFRAQDGVSVVTTDAAGDANAIAAAALWDAAWVISGGYQRVGEQLRVTARVFDVSTGELVHSMRADGSLDDLSALLQEVVDAVSAALAAPGGNARVNEPGAGRSLRDLRHGLHAERTALLATPTSDPDGARG